MAELTVKLSDGDIERIAEAVALRMPKPEIDRAAQGSVVARKLLFSEREAAEALGIGQSTLKRWRLAGIVRSHTTSKPIRYSAGEIDHVAQYMAARDGAA